MAKAKEEKIIQEAGETIVERDISEEEELQDNSVKVKRELEVKFVDNISHNFFVAKKKRFGKVMFYLLQDCTINKEGEVNKRLNVFKSVKESLDSAEHFTGKMVEYPDIERKISVIKTVATGKDTIGQKEFQERLLHKLKDFALATAQETQSVFGDEFVGFFLATKDNNQREFLFTMEN